MIETDSLEKRNGRKKIHYAIYLFFQERMRKVIEMAKKGIISDDTQALIWVEDEEWISIYDGVRVTDKGMKFLSEKDKTIKEWSKK